MADVTQDMDRLSGAGLVLLAATQPEIEYLFRHALVQDAVYSTLLRSDRRRLHTLVARTLEARYGGSDPAVTPVLAHHFHLAGDNTRALRYFSQAADQALTRYSNAEAVAHYQTALTLTDRPAERAPLLLGLGHALFVQGFFVEALATIREALAIYQALDDPAGLARAYNTAALIAHSEGNDTSSNDLLQAGLAAMAGHPESADTLALLQTAGRLSFFRGQPAEAAAFADRALAVARRLGDLRGELEAQITLSTARSGGDDVAVQRFQATSAHAEAAGFWATAALAHQNAGVILWSQGHVAAACAHFVQAGEDYRRSGYLFQTFHAAICECAMRLLLGEVAAVAGALPRLRQMAAQTNTHVAAWNLACLESSVVGYQGDLARAVATLQTLVAEARRIGSLQLVLVAGRELSAFLLESADWPAAQEFLTALVPMTARRVFFDAVWAQARLSEVAAATGDLPEATRRLAAATAAASAPPTPFEAESLALARARLAAAEGRRAATLAAYAEAAAIQAAIGLRRHRARTLRTWAAVLVAGGTPAEHAAACARLAEARAEFAVLDLPHEVAATDRVPGEAG